MKSTKSLYKYILIIMLFLPLHSSAQDRVPSASQDIPRLIKELKGDDEDRSSRAGQRLATLRDLAIPALVQASKDKNWGKRDRAVYVLGHCGPKAAPQLYKILEASTGRMQSQALSGIRRVAVYRKESIPRLLPFLKSKNPVLKGLSEQIFIEMKSGDALRLLYQIRPQLRGRIVEAAVKLDVEGRAPFLKLLASDKEQDRQFATEIFARSGPAHTAGLRQILKGSDRRAAHLALQLLLSYGPKVVIPWEELQRSLHSSSLEEKVLAYTALERITEPKEALSAFLTSSLSDASVDLRSVAALVALRKSSLVHDRHLSILKVGLKQGRAKTKLFILRRLPPFIRNDSDFAPLLVALAKDTQPELRSAALRCMGVVPSLFQSHALTLFHQLLSESDPRLKRSYLDLLSELRLQDAVGAKKEWLSLLETIDFGVQRGVLVCLSKIKTLGEKAELKISKLLSSPDAVVKQNALVVLTRWETRDPVVLGRFCDCLGDKDRGFRSQAGQALLKRSKAALPVMREALKTATGREKCNLLSLLGQLRDKSSRATIERCLRAKDPRLRVNAVLALSQLGAPSDEAGCEILVMAENDPVKAIRQIASRVRDQLKLKHTLQSKMIAWVGQFESGDALRRYEALTALVKQGKLAVPVLVKGLEHDSVERRYHCAGALGAMGEKASEAIPALSKRLKDPEKKVRDAAKKALSSILGLKRQS